MPIEDLPPKDVENLKALFDKYEVSTIHEFITDVYPKGYDLSAIETPIPSLSSLPDKTKVTVFGFIDEFKIYDYGKRLKRIAAKLYKDGNSVRLAWITSNQKARSMAYSLSQNAPKGALVQVSGKLSSWTPPSGVKIMTVDSPSLVAVSAAGGQVKEGYVVPQPLYVLRQKATAYQIKNAFRIVLNNLSKFVKEDRYFLPDDLSERLDLQPLKQSLSYMHGFKAVPVEKFNDFLNYRGFSKRIVMEKIWRIIRSSAVNDYTNNTPSISIDQKTKVSKLQVLAKKIPFELTIDQKKAIDRLINLFGEKSGSKSLVFGDVGSGKTLVALFVSKVLMELGHQVAFITPTGILSRQHYEEAVKYFGEDGLFFIDSKTKVREKRAIQKHLSSGAPALIIGTTSVNSLEFSDLKAVFVDEEQKMGVSAKEKLHMKYEKNPHIVYMTATPIPRTLAHSLFTNFEVLEIKTKPKGQKPRITKIVYFKEDSVNDQDICAINQRMASGGQTLIVVPSIDSDEMVNVLTTAEKYKRLFPRVKIEAVHGKMSKEETEKVISRYMDGEFEVLIATTMVDSGFSNQRISTVIVEGSDRFGISQLHQIRGRCGRGQEQGFCYLVPGPAKLKDSTWARLSYLTQTENGFKLAEKDIELRGSGDLEGETQSGFDLNFLDWVAEINIMRDYILERKSKKKMTKV